MEYRENTEYKKKLERMVNVFWPFLCYSSNVIPKIRVEGNMKYLVAAEPTPGHLQQTVLQLKGENFATMAYYMHNHRLNEQSTLQRY